MTSRTLNITWKFPIADDQNGVIVSHTILLEDRDDVNGYAIVQENDTEELGIVLEELLPFHIYYVRVAASTQVGLGPYTTRVLIEMPEDGRWRSCCAGDTVVYRVKHININCAED